MSGLITRRRYFVVASVLYILAGIVILVRAALGGVIPVMILGLVFVALGAVRLRDFARWRNDRP